MTRSPSLAAVDSSECSNTVTNIVMDYSTEFTTDEIFKSKNDMVQWTREVGTKNGIVVVIKYSDAGTLTKRPRVTFGCERGGTYRVLKQKSDVEIPIEKRRNTGTKKCGCPFTLKGQKLATDDDWSLKVVCGVHNHPTVTYHEGHPFSRRLSSEETSLLADMSMSLVRPKDILVTLKSRDPNTSSTVKTIYNVRQRLKVAEKAWRSHMQALLGKLAEKNYFEFHRSFGDTNYVQDLFWAHPVGIDLLHTFPRVLIMDCTYKTNRYKLPLFEVVGMTSTDKTFTVSFAFIRDEKEENYKWALDRLRTLMDPNDLPQVIVTDRELALMNAIAKVFPGASHMLCSWHVEKNIASKCKNFFETKREWDKFNSIWNLIVYASTEEEYNSHVSTMNAQFKSYPDAIKYATDNWLNPYKEKFVAAWTDRHMHFGNTTTNRVESAHARLKKQLGSSQGNFETTWTAIDGFLELQHTNIKASFEKSKTVVQHNHQPALFRDLRGCISMAALDLVLAQSKRADSVGVDVRVCGCVIRRTHGLPCAHEIAEYKREGRPIPLKSIDVHWTRLSMVPMEKMMLSFRAELGLLVDHFNTLDESAKKHLQQKMRELASFETTNLEEQHVKTKSRGRPSGKKAKVDTSTKRVTAPSEAGSSKKQVVWTTAMDSYFLELILQHNSTSRKPDNGLRREQLQAIVTSMNERFDEKLEVANVKNHFKYWNKLVQSHYELRRMSGFGWDPVTKIIEAPKETWENYKKQSKHGDYWKGRPLPAIVEEVAKYMGMEVATGEDSVVGSDPFSPSNNDDGAHVEGFQTQADMGGAQSNFSLHSTQGRDSSPTSQRSTKKMRMVKGPDPMERVAEVMNYGQETGAGSGDEDYGVDSDGKKATDTLVLQ